MDHITKVKLSHIPYSQDATMLLEEMKSFPVEEFEEWLKEKMFIAGSGHIIEFLRFQRINKTKELLADNKQKHVQ